MKLVLARRNFLLLHNGGEIHYPFSKFLTDKFSNPNTRELAAQALRILYRFCNAHQIELTLRALEARCLSYNEAKNLCELCFRPLPEIEAMGDKKIISLASAKAGKAPRELTGSVEPNTASKRLNQIAQYLDFYREVFLDPNIHSGAARERLKLDYDKICRQLRTAVKGTKQNHHLGIQSLPSQKFLSIIEAVFVRFDELFLSESSKPSSTHLRDRAMTLLACEGLRPGTLGNIAISDFRLHSGHLVIKDNRAKRSERISTNTPTLKMGNSTQVNNASETMIQLWPFTVRAIQDYIDDERSAVLTKRLTNRSDGFLFLGLDGGPIKHRATITAMFNKLGKRLAALGLLDVGNDPYFPNQNRYDFYGYVLRHSAASFFLAHKCTEMSANSGVANPQHYQVVPDRVKDLMKLRFGWTASSKMPELYAARALSDNANMVLMDFNQRLLDAVQSRRRGRAPTNGI